MLGCSDLLSREGTWMIIDFIGDLGPIQDLLEPSEDWHNTSFLPRR